MNDAVLGLLGIARRAGRLTVGFDAVCASVTKGESRLILAADDTSEGTLRKLRSSVGESGINIIGMPYGIDDINAAIGKPVRLISINDGGFAQKVKGLLEKGNGEE